MLIIQLLKIHLFHRMLLYTSFMILIDIFESDLVYLLYLSYKIEVKFIFVYQKSLTHRSKTGFWVQNHLLNLFSRVVNSQRLFYSQKTVVKCSHYIYRFMVYKRNSCYTSIENLYSYFCLTILLENFCPCYDQKRCQNVHFFIKIICPSK